MISAIVGLESYSKSAIEYTCDMQHQFFLCLFFADIASIADRIHFISFTNNLNTPLSFEFLFSSFVSADIDVNGSLGTNDDSSSYAEISLFDKDMDELFFSSAEAFIGGDLISSETNDNQSLRVNLQGKESNEIYGIVYSDGYAESVRESVSVPEPSIIWLMTLGLFGLLTQKTRQRSNNHIKNMM